MTVRAATKFQHNSTVIQPTETLVNKHNDLILKCITLFYAIYHIYFINRNYFFHIIYLFRYFSRFVFSFTCDIESIICRSDLVFGVRSREDYLLQLDMIGFEGAATGCDVINMGPARRHR